MCCVEGRNQSEDLNRGIVLAHSIDKTGCDLASISYEESADWTKVGHNLAQAKGANATEA